MAGPLPEGSVVAIVLVSIVLLVLYAWVLFSKEPGLKLVGLGLLTGLGAVLLAIFSQGASAAVRAGPGSVQVATGLPVVEALMRMAVLLVAGGVALLLRSWWYRVASPAQEIRHD